MNTYSKLLMHLERHVYKRGQYKGDAPADRHSRGKSHFRVVKHHDRMVVRLYAVNILAAYPDGRVVINTNTWHNYSTTRLRLNEALGFVGFGQIYMRKVMGLSQPVFRVSNNAYRYYDGMEFSEDGTLLSAPKPFEMRRIDKAESDAFMAEVKASGFKDMFPLLYATATPPEERTYINAGRLRETLTDADRAVNWPDIISVYKYNYVYNYKAGRREHIEKGTAKTCWSEIMKDIKKDMYVTLKSDITTL
jgi:hypothetical protein